MIFGENTNNIMKKHQKNFCLNRMKNGATVNFQSQNCTDFTKNVISPEPFDRFQCPLEGRWSSILANYDKIFILLRNLEVQLYQFP